MKMKLIWGVQLHHKHVRLFDTALEWLESKGSTDPAHLMLVKGWRDDAAKERWRSMKQTKITFYFK